MVKYENVLVDTLSVLKKFTKDRAEIGEDTDLEKQLNLDSLQIMELLLEAEDYFDIPIPVSILSEVRTVKDLVMQIEKLTTGEE